MNLRSPPGRLQGFKKAMNEFGLKIEKEWIVSGDWHYDNGYKNTERFIKKGKIPEAIVAGNDLIAIGVIKAINDAELTVPVDIAVIGCDDREIAQNYCPRITTVKLPLFEMRRKAAKKLFAKIEGQTVEK